MEDSDNQKYCLKWKNFQSNFMSQFETLKEEEDFVDVTLSCCGQSIKAHKVVLSACSPYLKNIFKEHPYKHTVVILDNLSLTSLEAVIKFVYTGQVYVEHSELSSFLKAAEALQIRGLFESSTTPGLIDTNLPQFSETDNTTDKLPTKKRDISDTECEIKKVSNKRVTRTASDNFTKEATDFKNKEKDCTTNIDHRPEGTFENTHENSSLNIMSEMEQNLENVEKGLAVSFGEEDYINADQRKLHWLKPRSCPLCNRTYSNLSNLRQHMKLIHNPTLVTCKLCYKTFKTALYLRRHLIGFHEMNVNGTNGLSIEPYKPVHNQPPAWNPNIIKSEPDAFNEIFNTSEMYQVSE